jgi:hypothetical protein
VLSGLRPRCSGKSDCARAAARGSGESIPACGPIRSVRARHGQWFMQSGAAARPARFFDALELLADGAPPFATILKQAVERAVSWNKGGGGRASSKRARMCWRPMLAALVCALLAAGLAAVAFADRPHPDPNVAGLQTALAVKGFYRGPIDGLRGPLTTAALRALQRQFRLPSSNLIDRRTRAVLGPLGRPRYRTRVLQQRMVGLDVAALQFELRYHGFPTPENGSFDDRTLLALKRFQRFVGNPADGVAGNTTYEALSKPPPLAPKLRTPLPLIQRAIRVGDAVELVCPYASAIAASIGGTVVFAGDRPRGYGYTVITRDAKGLVLLYAHLARIDVHDRQQLLAGAMIGLAGWTGKKRPETSLRLELRLRDAQLNTYTALYSR